jgi:hypothetical protein
MTSNITEDQLYNMSDEELEAAVLEIRAEEANAEIEETDKQEETTVTEEELEQPSEDSNDNNDDDLNTEEKTEEDESDEELEAEEDPLDKEPFKEDNQAKETESEDKIEDTDKEAEEETEGEESSEETTNELDAFMNTKSIVKANGREFEFTNQEKLDAFDKLYPQAMDYTKKTQALKPWRKTIDALETANIKHEDINLMIDVLKGDKDAIAQVLKRTGIDTLDLDLEESVYQPKDYGRDDAALDLKEVVDRIGADKEYEYTHKVLSNEWDETSFAKMTANPDLIYKLHSDVKNGLYDKIQPMAYKAKVLAGPHSKMSDLDFYIEAANQYNLEQIRINNKAKEEEQIKAQKTLKEEAKKKVAKVKASQAKIKTTKQAASKRKAAAPAKTNAGAKRITDYLDDSDEAFEEWYSKMLDHR